MGFEIMIDITNFVKISPFVDRYFVKFFYPWKQHGIVKDHFTFQHTNKLVMVGLSHRHHLIANQFKIAKIEYPGIKNTDMTKVVKGKKKKGGVITGLKTLICNITCENGQVFEVKSIIHGSLIEVNERIIHDPEILLKYPESDGYICILNQARNQKKIETLKHLVHEKEYLTLGDEYYNELLGYNGTHRPLPGLRYEAELRKQKAAEGLVAEEIAEEGAEPGEEDCPEPEAKPDLE